MITHRNMNARNYGLRSRDMIMAAKNALTERQMAFSSIATMISRFSSFAELLETEMQIKDMRFIERHHVIAFSESVAEAFETGKINLATAHNRISAANVVLSQARGDNQLMVSARAFLPARNFIAVQTRAPSLNAKAETLRELGRQPYGERFQTMVESQHRLGLRFEESAKANNRTLLAQAEKYGVIRICDGTKGGLTRTIPITDPGQLNVLQRATSIQGGHHSLIPKDLSYAQFQSAAYRALQPCPVDGYHDFRHGYATDRYETLAGAPCPVAAGVAHGNDHFLYLVDKLGISIQQARELDHDARNLIAKELGHRRTQITGAYLG